MPLSETELFDRHQQALGEAHRACQKIGRNADPDYIAPRGPHYTALRKALQHLEGSARQIQYFRNDARWLRLSIYYAKIMREAQAKFVGQRWKWFAEATVLFERGVRFMDELREAKTGRLSNSPILPQNPSSWLVLPDYKPAVRPPSPYRLQ